MSINCKKAKGRFVCALMAMLVSGVGLSRLNAQGATATLLGTVTDSTGAAVPGASVQAKNIGTGAIQNAISDNAGRFSVPDLGVGSYEVQASKTGFATVVHSGITLTVGAQSVVDFALTVGQQTQTITVQGEVSQVETTNATVGTFVSGQQI